MSHGDDVVLDEIVERFRRNRGRLAKQGLHHVSATFGPTDWATGPGDDAALIPRPDGGVLAAGEALYPPFVATDPFGAGVAAVIANVNDVAAMGGRPLAIVDTVIAPDAVARQILGGLRHAADLYAVPVVGGHLTIADVPPSLSAFVVGEVSTPLLARNALPGHTLLLATCLDGRLREDFGFYPSYEHRGGRVRGDVDVLAQIADAGAAVAAKDISMAGTLGTLAMLLQPTGRGAVVRLDDVPAPTDVPLATWLDVFPSYGFLLCAPAERADEAIAAFTARGLACSRIGAVDDSGGLHVRLGTAETTLLADIHRTATGLGD